MARKLTIVGGKKPQMRKAAKRDWTKKVIKRKDGCEERMREYSNQLASPTRVQSWSKA